jgi:hypothetical protein
MAMAGGAAYYGVHAITVPSLYGSDSANVVKRCWYIPVAGIIGGHFLARIQKITPVGHGLAGGATAIGIEQIQMAFSIKKNQQPAAAAPAGTGALLEPSDVHSRPQLASNVGEVEDAGALWQAPVREAAGLGV